MKKTNDEIKAMFNKVGREREFDIPVSDQALAILKHLDWTDEQWKHFVEWYIKKHVSVGGAYVLQYLQEHGG